MAKETQEKKENLKKITITYDVEKNAIGVERDPTVTVIEELGIATYYFNLIKGWVVPDTISKRIADEVMLQMDMRSVELAEALSKSFENTSEDSAITGKVVSKGKPRAN